MLLEISDALRRTENVHFMSDEDLKRFREIHLQLGVVLDGVGPIRSKAER